MLLAIVLGFVLVLVGITASALVAVASSHVATATVGSVVSRDASLVELFVNGTLRATDLDADGPDPDRTAELNRHLLALARDDGIARIELRALDGRVLASDLATAVGERAPMAPAAVSAIDDGTGSAELIEDRGRADVAVPLPELQSLVQEYLPIVDGAGQTVAVVALWRDATDLLAVIDTTRRDIMAVTLVAGVLLAGMLLLLFRASQARLTRQHRQILDAGRRDALTGLLNHGAVVETLEGAVEAARTAGETIAVVLVDVDNFRLFNDTHGHDAGDHVLLRVAEVVGAEVAGRHDGGHLARYGPDEFLAVLRDGGVAEAESLARRVQLALEAVSVQFGESEELPVTVSAGIAAMPLHADAVTELLSAAAVALGEAKAGGGDAVCVAHVGEEERVASGSLDVLQGLVIAVDTKDRYTKRHSEDVARYATFPAERIGHA
jgi:diguanylate cyclase (GGDEF)-like protein